MAEPPKLRHQLALGAASIAGTLILSAVAFIFNGVLDRLEGLEGLTSGLAVTSAATQRELQDYKFGGERHLDDHPRFDQGIGNLRVQVAALETALATAEAEIQFLDEQVADLYSVGGKSKRFTSDDGAILRASVMENRQGINALRERLHQCERCCDKVIPDGS